MSTRLPPSERPAEELDDRDDRDELRDRYYGLLQELRVVLPGVQILAAFMLTVPFAPRFAQVDSWGEVFFGVALSAAVLSVVCFMTPTALHRFGSRTARGARLKYSILITRIGIALLGLALVASLAVVTRFLFAPVVAGIILGVTVLTMIGLWVMMPARLHRDQPRPE